MTSEDLGSQFLVFMTDFPLFQGLSGFLISICLSDFSHVGIAWAFLELCLPSLGVLPSSFPLLLPTFQLVNLPASYY